MLFTAVVCSVNRPGELRRSLQALNEQERVPDAIVVVAQSSDAETIRVARECGALVTEVSAPGLALAVESAISSVDSGIVAFVDDDARAHPDWSRRIEEAFMADESLGALGGRDNVDGDDRSGSKNLQVGIITSSGRIIGNHHLGKGSIRPAATLKGANMAVRVEAAHASGLSRLVQGSGAQYRNELILTALVRRRGYGVAYDPRIQVDHFPAKRLAGDDRKLFSPDRIRLNVTNELIGLAVAEPARIQVAYAVRMVIVGTRLHPGLAHLILGTTRRSRGIWGRTRATWATVGKAPSIARSARSLDRSTYPPKQFPTE